MLITSHKSDPQSRIEIFDISEYLNTKFQKDFIELVKRTGCIDLILKSKFLEFNNLAF